MDDQNPILVIDDEPSGFEVIEALLHTEGYHLRYISSGIEALNLLDSLQPDVILLDIMMPQMDGIETCRRIKSNSEWNHIPIIMVTALSSKQDLARSLNAGADDFLPKPINGLELRSRVRSMLRIKQQYDALAATLQLREDLSNMLVHDLRNPLTNILLSSQLLMQYHELEGKVLERVERIHSYGRQLSFMIDDLLMLAKMESGKLVLNWAEINLNELAVAIMSQFQTIADSKKLHLVSLLPNVGRQVCIDTNLLYRVLDNLISNALKFSPTGSTVSLQVIYPNSLASTEESTLQAIIKISDSGPGIREEMRQVIFNKYEVGNLVSGTSQIGLGLSFCKMVTEAHGGRIYVEDNQPQGSIFIVEI